MEGSLWKPRLVIDKGAGGLPYFRHAIKRAAANILIVHNHPSGTLTPSAEDLEVTDRLVEVGKIVGIDVVDHLIIGDYEYLSFKEKGYIV